MPVSGGDSVRKRIKSAIHEIRTIKTASTLNAVLITGSSNAALLTPNDTGNLINSQYIDMQETSDGMKGAVGYTAKYAAWVHEMPMTLKGKERADFGKTSSGVSFGGGSGRGRYWEPNKENYFLKKGFERDGLSEIQRIIKEGYHV